MSDDNFTNQRCAEHIVEQIFLDRWSPRAFTPEEMREEELLSLLEAARWAPSSFNVQPWRYVYARRGTPYWEEFVDLLMEFNQIWAVNAAVLLFLVSDTQSQDREGNWRDSRTHSFDAGASWAYLALHATMRGWQAHGMAGIHLDRIRVELGVPPHCRVEIAIAIGRQAAPDILSDKLRAREVPSSRRRTAEFAFEARFQSNDFDLERMPPKM